MPEIRTETEIDAPPSRVWDVLSDFARYPDWNPFLTVSGQPIVGSPVIVWVKTPLLRIPLRCTIAVADPKRELRWRGHLLRDGIIAGSHYFGIEPRGADRSCFVHGEVFTGALSSVAWAIIRRDTTRGYARMNAAFKARCEAVSASRLA